MRSPGLRSVFATLIIKQKVVETLSQMLTYGNIDPRQHLCDQNRYLNIGGLAHRNPKESEDEPEILRPTRAGASRRPGS